jgi:hypothetical protein
MHIKNNLDENQLLVYIKTMKEIYKDNTSRVDYIQSFQNDIELKIKQLNEEREIDETYLIKTKKLKIYKSEIKLLDSIEGAYTYTTNEDLTNDQMVTLISTDKKHLDLHVKNISKITVVNPPTFGLISEKSRFNC